MPRTCSSSVTSAWMARSPSAFSDRSTPTTVAPSSLKRLAVSAPMPLAAPVITHTLPSSRRHQHLRRVVDVLDLAVVVERVRAELAAVARLLEAAERRGHPHGRVRVDRDHAALDRARRAQRLGAVARPDRAREAVDRVVREPDRLLLVAERDHRGHRAEDLLARGAVVVVDRAEHRRREPEAGAVGRAAADRHRRVVRHERGHGLALALRDQRAHLGGLVERVADPDRLDRLLEHLHEAVERRALDEDARARAAVLAGVAEHRARRGRPRPSRGRRRRRRRSPTCRPARASRA